MICSVCGNNVADGEKICDFCGSPIKTESLNNVNTEEIDKQQTDSMDMYNSEDTLNVEKRSHEEKKETDITEKNTSHNHINEVPETQSSYETDILGNKSDNVSNGNNVDIYVMLGTIIALVCFIVIIININLS